MKCSPASITVIRRAVGGGGERVSGVSAEEYAYDFMM